MPRLDSSKIMAGFRGAFFWDNGDQMGECRSWGVTRTQNNSDEGTLDDPVDHPVQQSLAYGLTFSVIRIHDEIQQKILAADRAAQTPWFRFIGEVRRPDGGIGRYVIDRVTPDGSSQLFGMERGNTYRSDYTWRADGIPDVDSALAA